MGIKTNSKGLILGTLSQLTMLLLWLSLAGCGGGGDGGGTDGEGVSVDAAPRVEVSFPLPNANLAGETDRITLRGTAVAADDAEVTRVLVNNRTFSIAIPGSQGLQFPQPPADLPDGDSPMVQYDKDTSRWSTKIALLRQTNDIKIEASDNLGRVREVNLEIRNTTTFSDPKGVVLDAANNRALLIDDGLDVLLAVDLTSGDIRLISGLSTGTGPAFAGPQGLALDSTNNRVLVGNIEPFNSAILSVDLTSGDRITVTDSNAGSEMALYMDNTRVLVVNSNSNLVSLVEVDLNSGNRRVLSNANIGTGPAFADPRGVALYADNSRALVIEGFSGDSVALLEVDLSNGNRQVISDSSTGTGPAFADPRGVALYADNTRALVVEGFNGLVALLEVDLGNGNRRVISDATTGTGAALVAPERIAIDNAKNRALLVDRNGSGVLLSVDLSNGNRSLIAEPNASGTGPRFRAPRAITLDAANKRALVVESNTVSQALLEVDIIDGDRRIISDASIGSGPAFMSPHSIALDTANNRALVLDSDFILEKNNHALLAVDLDSGDRSVISDESIGSGPSLFSSFDVALDSENNRALVGQGGNEGVLLAVDLSNGNRRVISDANTGTGPSLSIGGGLALDAANNRALVLAFTDVLVVDLNNGDRRVTSDANTGTGPFFSRLIDIVLDTTNQIAFLLNGQIIGTDDENKLMEMDLINGNRRVISDASKGVGPKFSTPEGLAFDESNNLVFVLDSATPFNTGLKLLLAVDVPSGDRVIVSQ